MKTNRTIESEANAPLVLTRSKPLLASFQNISTIGIEHITAEKTFMPNDSDRFVQIHHLLQLLQAAGAEAKSLSAHPESQTRVGVRLEDVAGIRIAVGRAPSLNTNLFEKENEDQAKVELLLDKSLEEKVAPERENLVAGKLTAEAFTKSIFTHDDPQRVARLILKPRLFVDTRATEPEQGPAHETPGPVKLSSERSYRITLHPISVNGDRLEATAYLDSVEENCPLFVGKDLGARRVLLKGHSERTHGIIGMCCAAKIEFSADVLLQIRATPNEIRYTGEVESIHDLDRLRAAIARASSDLFPKLI